MGDIADPQDDEVRSAQPPSDSHVQHDQPACLVDVQEEDMDMDAHVLRPQQCLLAGNLPLASPQ